MPSSCQVELNLPARIDMEPLVLNFVLTLGTLAGLPHQEAESLAQEVWLGCLNAIHHAYDADDQGSLRLVGNITPAALTLAVHDLGLPYYYTLDHPDQPVEASRPAAVDCSPAASHSGADEIRWLNHGNAGNELLLKKNLAGLCLLAHPTSTKSGQPADLANTAGGYTVRLLQPEDAVQVAQLMYRVYGYSYSNEDFYYPDRLAHDLQSGRHVGVIAQTSAGEIVGHVGIERSEANHLAELGQLAVAPAHRGHGLRNLMGDCLQREIQHLGLVGLFAEAVTIHTISQEGSEYRGLYCTGIKLLDWQALFKKKESFGVDAEPQAAAGDHERRRETMVLYFKYLNLPGVPQIYAPLRHRPLLEKLYARLGTPVEFLDLKNCSNHSPRQAEIELHYDKAIKLGAIQVNRPGRNAFAGISQACQDLTAMAGADVIALYLPLFQPGTPHLCGAVQKLGFFFSGLQPHFTLEGDFLRLQRLNVPLDETRIHLASSESRELLEYVLADRRRRHDH